MSERDVDHPCEWICCPACGSAAAVLIDWRPDPETTLKCTECGARCAAEWHDDCIELVYPP